MSAILAFSSVAQVQAQVNHSDAQASVPTLKLKARAVIVDVLVVDHDGRPVVGLHKQDFAIRDDGKPQVINFFEEHEGGEPPVVVPPALPPHVYSNGLSAAPSNMVNVILLDSLNTSQSDQARVQAQANGFLAAVDTGTQVAIFRLGTHLRLLQGFTSDKSLLEVALNRKGEAQAKTLASRDRGDALSEKEDIMMQGGTLAGHAEVQSLAAFGNMQAGQRATLTFEALAELARALAELPGRKNVLWFASSFPVSMFPDSKKPQTLSNGRSIPQALREALNLQNQSRIAIYPVSAQGILADPNKDAENRQPQLGDNPFESPQDYSIVASAIIATMEKLASDTGGEAIYTTNDVGKAGARAVNNAAHYYTLAYTPPDKKSDGKLRSIDVTLTAGNYKLTYRRGYYAEDERGPLGAASPAASDPLVSLLKPDMLSATQIVYQVRVLPADPQPAQNEARAGGNAKLSGPLTRYKADFSIPTASLDLDEAADGTRSGKIEVALIAYGPDGHALNWTAGQLNVTLNPASYEAATRLGIPAHLQVDLPQADVTLATGVYTFTSNKAGTLAIPIGPR